MKRLCLKIEGVVQGVGFRLVYQLATTLGLSGWVKNSSEGVLLKLEGDRPILESLTQLSQEKPTLAQIQAIQSFWGEAVGYEQFQN